MPKVRKSSSRSRKGNVFISLWKWFLGTHFITKSVIVFGIAVILALPSIFQANWNFPATTKAYGWLGNCGSYGQDICTTQPWYYGGIIYQEAVPGNQCAITGTDINLPRGQAVYCCGHNPGGNFAGCGSGQDTCTTSSACANLVDNYSFETQGIVNSACPAPGYADANIAASWFFGTEIASDGQNHFAQSCAARDWWSGATDGSNSLSMTVAYNNDVVYPPYYQQHALLYADNYNIQPYITYQITYDARSVPDVAGDNTGGVADVYLQAQGSTYLLPLASNRSYPGGGWGHYSTGQFTMINNLYNRIVFDVGAKSQHIWIDNVNLQEVYPVLGNIYSSNTEHTQCGINATKGGWPRGTMVYCVKP